MMGLTTAKFKNGSVSPACYPGLLSNINIRTPGVCSFRRFTVATLVVIIFFFTLVFINSIIFDLRDAEGDAASGVKTIPVVFGVRRTINFLACLNLLFGLVDLLLCSAYLSSKFTYLLAAGMVYAIFYIFSFGKVKRTNLLCDAVADGQFLIFGSLLYIAV
ncbi:MAG: UbiA family prenyltransferase [Candidatus Methanoperedens sp.]